MKTSRPVHGARTTLVGLLAGLLFAAAMAGPARAEPRTYQIDPDHFSIAFSVRHLGFADTIGLFLKGSGSFVYDEQTRALSSGRVVVKADSVFTNHGARDKHVRDSDFLDAKAHPEIVFEATGFESGADGSGTLSGRLTLLGQTHPVTLDVRFIAIGKEDLAAAMARGAFREDLYWRLNVAVLHVPPLSARREDVPLLFVHLVRESAARHNIAEREVAPVYLSELAARDWPGNVRELRNLAERYALGLEGGDYQPTDGTRLAERVAEFERGLIAGAIAAHGGRLRPVYETLGISRKTLYEKMQKHGLDRRMIRDSGEGDPG